jgi:plasmid stabilization system protein ParE
LSLHLIVREEAESDIDSAFEWYEKQKPGLGTDFIRSVDEAMDSVQRDPELYPFVYRHARRALLHRFPYGVYYVIQGDYIEVVACAHFRRNPRRWQARVP